MIHSTAWALILQDWKNGNATVTVTLRSGTQFTGKVKKNETDGPLGDELQLEEVAPWQGKHTLHSIDMDEIVAITAVAP